MKRFRKHSALVVVRYFVLLAVIAIAGQEISPNIEAAGKFETRCGWFENPTPANAWLTDRHGEWIISLQGSYQAEGDWPTFSAGRWIETNGSYGYGCACMSVSVDRKNMKVVEIKSSYSRPLSSCRKDRALKEPR